MKKSTTKTIDPQKEIELNNPTNETKTELTGTTPKSMTTTSKTLTTDPQRMNLTDKIKELFPKAQTTRVIIDDLREDNLWLLDWLWVNQYQLIVASDNTGLLNQTNLKIINLSGSMGRWRIVTYPQSLIEPSDCFVMYKELEDEQISQVRSRQVVKSSEYEGK